MSNNAEQFINDTNAQKLKIVEVLITCPLCGNHYYEPKTLPSCGHTFCCECLAQKSDGEATIVVCPECQLETQIQQNCEELPTNRFLEKIVSVLSLLPSPVDPLSQFDNCRLGKAAEAILQSAEVGRMDIAKFLLDAYSPVLLETRLDQYYGCTLLCLAASAANLLELVRHLVVDRGANVRASCSALLGPTPVHFAASFGRVEVLDFLLSLYPDLLYARDDADRTPLCVAAENGKLACVRYLVERWMADPWTRSSVNGPACSIPICLAVDAGKLDVVAYFLENEPEMLDFTDGEGETLLTRAAASATDETVSIIRYLVQVKHVEIDQRNQSGMTPLHVAVVFGESPAIVDCLVSLGADIDAVIGNRCSEAELHGKTIFNVEIINDSIRHYVQFLKKSSRTRQKV